VWHFFEGIFLYPHVPVQAIQMIVINKVHRVYIIFHRVRLGVTGVLKFEMRAASPCGGGTSLTCCG